MERNRVVTALVVLCIGIAPALQVRWPTIFFEEKDVRFRAPSIDFARD